MIEDYRFEILKSTINSQQSTINNNYVNNKKLATLGSLRKK